MDESNTEQREPRALHLFGEARCMDEESMLLAGPASHSAGQVAMDAFLDGLDPEVDFYSVIVTKVEDRESAVSGRSRMNAEYAPEAICRAFFSVMVEEQHFHLCLACTQKAVAKLPFLKRIKVAFMLLRGWK